MWSSKDEACDVKIHELFMSSLDAVSCKRNKLSCTLLHFVPCALHTWVLSFADILLVPSLAFAAQLLGKSMETQSKGAAILLVA